MLRGLWAKVKGFEYPAQPTLEPGETLVAQFRGLRAGVTLTDRRIITSRLGHRSFAYDDVVDLDGGSTAGPHYAHLRDNADIHGGIYLMLLNGGEEWAHIPDSERAAALIRERTPNLWIEHRPGISIDAWRKQLLDERSAAETERL